jgi:hypothetical protein
VERMVTVDGRPGQVTVEGYARLVANEVETRVSAALRHMGEDSVLSGPERVAYSLVDVMNLPGAA